MEKIIISIFACSFLILFNCSKNENTQGIEMSSGNNNTTPVATKYYKNNGQVFKVDFVNGKDSVLEPVQSRDFETVNSIMESPTSSYLYNEKSDTIVIGKNTDDLMSNIAKPINLAKRNVQGGAYLFENGYYLGRRLECHGYIPDLVPYGFNDITSSIQFSGFSTVIVFENSNYGGHSIAFASADPNSTGYVGDLDAICMKYFLFWCTTSWNDQISSLQIR